MFVLFMTVKAKVICRSLFILCVAAYISYTIVSRPIKVDKCKSRCKYERSKQINQLNVMVVVYNIKLYNTKTRPKFLFRLRNVYVRKDDTQTMYA